MQWKRWIVTGALVCTLAFVGCGGKDGGNTTGPAGDSKAAPAAKPTPGSLAALVPANTVALVYVRAPGDLEQKVRQLVGKIDEDMVEEIQLEAMVGQVLQGAGEHWDPSKPIAIAIPLPADGQDMDEALGTMSMIFGMKDAAAAKKSMEAAIAKQMEGIPEKYRPKPEEQPKILVSGDYLTMGRGPEVKRGGAAIAATAPDSDIGLRIDLAALVARYRKDIDKGLDEMQEGVSGGLDNMPPGMEQLGGMFNDIAAWVKDFVNSAETLDLGISVDGGNVEFAVGFIAKKGSKLDKPSHDHAGLAALAKHLPDGMPVNALLSMDMGGMMELLQPLMEAGLESAPEDQREQQKAALAEMTEMYKLLGNNWAMALTMGDKGMQAVQIGDCKDGAAFVERFEKMFTVGNAMSENAGVSAKKSGSTTMSGVQVHSYEMSFDFEKLMSAQGRDAELPPGMLDGLQGIMNTLFGGDTMKVQVATVDNKLLYTMGDAQVMEAAIASLAKGGGKAPAGLQAGLDRTGGKPTFLLNADLRALAQQIIPLVRKAMDEKIPDAPKGGPIPVTVWGMHDGRVYGGGLKVDVGGIVEMVEAMDK